MLAGILYNVGLGLAIVLAALIVLAQLQQWQTRRRLTCPVAPTMPFLGSFLALTKNRHRMNEWLAETREKAGPTFAAVMPFQAPIIVTCDPACVEHMLKTNFDNYVKGKEFQNRFAEILGRGIFTSDGQEWYVQRKTASHMFTTNSFRDHMTEVFRRNGEEMVRLLGAAADKGEVVDMQSMYFRFTLDSVGEISFGVNIGSLANPRVEFSHAFDRAQAICEARFFNPFWRILRLVSPETLELNKAVRTMDTFALQVISNRRRESLAELSNRKDLLSRFMEMEITDNAPTDEYLRDVIMNFMIAGRDTTANAMSWTTYLLTQHPDVMKRMQAEIDAVDELGYDSLKSLEYTTSVVMEALRLYPSVPKDGKFAVRDDVLPDGTFIPAGALVAYCPYAMGRSADLWPEPLKFDPLRFYQQPRPSAFKYSAFQAGPRVCLGQNMALFEASVCLATIFKRFTMEPLSSEKPAEGITVTLPMRDGFPVRLRRRNA